MSDIDKECIDYLSLRDPLKAVIQIEKTGGEERIQYIASILTAYFRNTEEINEGLKQLYEEFNPERSDGENFENVWISLYKLYRKDGKLLEEIIEL